MLRETRMWSLNLANSSRRDFINTLNILLISREQGGETIKDMSQDRRYFPHIKQTIQNRPILKSKNQPTQFCKAVILQLKKKVKIKLP